MRYSFQILKLGISRKKSVVITHAKTKVKNLGACAYKTCSWETSRGQMERKMLSTDEAFDHN